MKYYAQYIIQLNSSLIEFDLAEEKTAEIKLLQVSRLSEFGKAPVSFQITLTFSALTDREAETMAAINNDSSVLILKEESEAINYDLKLSTRKLWLHKKLKHQLISCESLSA